MRTIALLALVLLVTFGVRLQPLGVQGRWKADVTTPFGPVEYTFTFRSEAGVLTGTAESQMGRVTLEDVRVAGDRLTFVEPLTLDGRRLRFEYEGQLAGHEIRFSRRVGTDAPASFVAYRDGGARAAPGPFPFQDPAVPDDVRLTDLVSRMTLDEKIVALGTNPRVTRLGVRGTPHVEGLHGLALGGPGNWGSRNPIPTTIFPQAIGLAETWDVDALHEVGAIEGFEARYVYQSPQYSRGGLVIRIPTPISAATSAGAAPRSATARTRSSTARWPSRSSRACKAITRSTGRPPR